MSATAKPLAEAPAEPATFTDEDRARLAELETTISSGLEEFLGVGRVLEEFDTPGRSKGSTTRRDPGELTLATARTTAIASKRQRPAQVPRRRAEAGVAMR